MTLLLSVRGERLMHPDSYASQFLSGSPSCASSRCHVSIVAYSPSSSPTRSSWAEVGHAFDRCRNVGSEQSPILEISQPAIELLAILLDMRSAKPEAKPMLEAGLTVLSRVFGKAN